MQTRPGTRIRVTEAEPQSRSRWVLCTFRKVWTTVALTSADEIYHHLTASSVLGITHTSSLLTHKTKGVDKNDPTFHKSDKFTFIFKIKFIISEFSLLHTVLTSQINHEIYSNKCSYMENTDTQSWLLNNTGASAHQHSAVWDPSATRSQPPVYTAPPICGSAPTNPNSHGSGISAYHWKSPCIHEPAQFRLCCSGSTPRAQHFTAFIVKDPETERRQWRISRWSR